MRRMIMSDKANREKSSTRGRCFARLAAIMLAALLAVAYLPASFSYADEESSDPIRELHKIGIGNKAYCFFVTHNVVMTPEEIQKIDNDDKLTEEVLERAGLYMKEENCRLEAHKAISPKDWAKQGGSIELGNDELKKAQKPADPVPEPADSETNANPGSETDVEVNEVIKALREASPTDGYPVRISADLIVKTDAKDNNAKGYTTHKANKPDLIFIAVATAADAKTYGEEICEDETKEEKANGKTVTPKDAGDKEMKPELRTIPMPDRSGGPLEPTLKEGDPVTLEWIEPGKQTDVDKEAGLVDQPWFVPALIAAALAIALAAILLIRRKKKGEEE